MKNDRIMTCPLVDVKKKKKKKPERGSFDFRSDGNIEIIRWNISVVTIGSNAYGLQLIRSAKRLIKGKRKQNIQQPAVIVAYNRVGRVDLLESALSDLRPVIRGKNLRSLHSSPLGKYFYRQQFLLTSAKIEISATKNRMNKINLSMESSDE